MFKLTSCETLHSNVKYWCIQNPTRMITIAARGVRRITSSLHTANESEKIQHISIPCYKTAIHKSSEVFERQSLACKEKSLCFVLVEMQTWRPMSTSFLCHVMVN